MQLLGADDALASIVSLMRASAAAVREQALFVLSVLLTRERAQLLAPAAPINVLPLLLPLLREGGAAAEGTRLNAAVCLMHLAAPALNLERLGTREVVEALRRLAGKEHLPGPGTPTAASRLPSTPERMRRVSLARAQTPDRSAQQVSRSTRGCGPTVPTHRRAARRVQHRTHAYSARCIACASLHRPDQFVRSFVRSFVRRRAPSPPRSRCGGCSSTPSGSGRSPRSRHSFAAAPASAAPPYAHCGTNPL